MRTPRSRAQVSPLLAGGMPVVFRSRCLIPALWSLVGCASVPAGRSAVDAVTVRGAKQVDDSDVTDKLATSKSPKFLGLFRGVVFDYEILDRFVLQRDLARVERLYRAKGYYEAHAIAGQVIDNGPGHVRVEVIVDEGAPVRVERVSVEGVDQLPPAIRDAAVRAANERLVHGEPFAEDDLTAAEGDVRRAMSDRGYAYTTVKRAAAVDLVRHTAKIVLTATPDKPSRFGKVTIEGLGELPEGPVRRALNLTEGSPYSEAELDSAQQAILELGVFASVDMRPELADPPPEDHVVPIVIKVEPSRLRTVRLGGGVEFDQLRADVHGLVGWESKNFLGVAPRFACRSPRGQGGAELHSEHDFQRTRCGGAGDPPGARWRPRGARSRRRPHGAAGAVRRRGAGGALRGGGGEVRALRSR